MVYIGVDLHKEQFTVCYRRSEDDQVLREFANDPTGIESFKKTLTCLDDLAVEAMGMSRHFVKQVQGSVRSVFLVNASQNTLIYSSHKKTDTNDAKLLAFGLEKGVLPRARFRSEAAHQLRALLNARDMLVWHRVRIMCHMYSILACNGINIDRTRLRSHVGWDQINPDRFQFGQRHAWSMYCRLMETARVEIVALEKEIEDASAQMAGNSVLRSVPGLGLITTAYLLAYIDRIEDFASPKAFTAYFGIVPRTRLSAGAPIPNKKFGPFRAGAITRNGDRRTRAMITKAVNRVMVENETLRAFYDRIKGRKGYRKARTAAARKLLTFLFFALKRNQAIPDFAIVDFSKPHQISWE